MKKIMAVLLAVMIGVFGFAVFRDREPAETAVVPVPAETPLPTPTPEPTPEIDFHDTSSLLVVANKANSLPEGYEPADLVKPNVRSSANWLLREPAARALEEMFAGAEKDGVYLILGSAYRSAAYQSQLWNGYAAQYGADRADRISSRPGYSDHQTGLAVDIVQNLGNDFNEAFENTKAAQWLHAHAQEYGWIMRYPKGKEDITGYAYEPWHFRYIGKEYAEAIYAVDEWETFEEYFGVEGGKDYKD